MRTFILRWLLRFARLLSPSLDALVLRISQDPGIPLAGPSVSYWAVPPSPLAQHGSSPDDKLPSYADVVIIGSGITGTSFARTLLDHDIGEKSEGQLKVVMLEARDACSGATARNGGHITPVLYHDYPDLKKQYGGSVARQILRFRLAHLPEFLSVAAEESLLQESQCREVQTFDVFHKKPLFEAEKTKLSTYRREFPKESAGYRVYDDAQSRKFQLSAHTAGCISTTGGAIHPYRLVTGILSRLLRCYSSSFQLFTHTPCTDISAPAQSMSCPLYTLTTPKGKIQTPHAIHATNGWASHLLPGMRGKIIPAKGTMTTQTPRKGLGEPSTPEGGPSWTGTRSFVFYPTSGSHMFDYLTQQPAAPSGDGTNTPSSPYPPPAGELMFGGGFTRGETFLAEIGNSDDRRTSPSVVKYLAGALANFFTVHEDGRDEDHERMKMKWSGILGISADGLPWVGRIPERITERSIPAGMKSASSVGHLACSGEWIAAGYTGEGMVHAWLCGRALALMVLGLDVHSDSVLVLDEELPVGDALSLRAWFPSVFGISEDRWKNATIEEMFASFVH